MEYTHFDRTGKFGEKNMVEEGGGIWDYTSPSFCGIKDLGLVPRFVAIFPEFSILEL